MRAPSTTLASLFALAALCAWGGVWYFNSAIGAFADAYTANAQNALNASAKRAEAVRFKALLADTQSERTQLSQMLSPTAFSVANMIIAAGKSAGVSAQVSDATPENFNTSGNPALLAVTPLGFSIEAHGSFSSLMVFSALLERLPLPSMLEQLDVSYVAGQSSLSGWQLSARLRVYTITPTSS